jgi:hypothetical protein
MTTRRKIVVRIWLSTMRAEIVTLIEEIKQSVGLLRRHL